MTSPSTLTLGQARNSTLVHIIGVCPTSDAFAEHVNECVGRLMNYGDWWNTVVKARICIRDNCITWPRWVGTVMGMNLSNHTRPLQNRWYEFMPITAHDCLNWPRWGSNVVGVDDGVSPVFENIRCGQAWAMRFYVRHQDDIGKAVTVYGIDENGQEVMTKDSNGDWILGEVVTLEAPYVDTTKIYREITRVVKTVTTGPLDAYYVDTTNSVLLDAAHYDPGETTPMYRHTTFRGGRSCVNLSTGGCGCPDGKARTVEILAKLQHIPAVADTDIIQIDNIPAIKLMLQTMKLEEAGNYDESAKTQAMAIKELNRVLRNKLPLDQIPVIVSGCGTALPEYHGIGKVW